MKERPERARLLEWLADPANFAEAFLRAGDEPVRLDPWQEAFLRSEARLTAVLKSRRVGGSWIMTARMFIRAQLFAPYSGVFVSMNREEARGKIEYAREMADSLPPRWRLRTIARAKDEIAFEDSRGRRSVLRSLAAKAPRGRGGDVGISELPHCLAQRRIYEGALHVIARDEGSQLTVESTPLAAQGVFHEICSGKYPGFSMFEVPWWLSSALCSDVARAAVEEPGMATPERVRIFGTPALRSIHGSMPSMVFRRESELVFAGADDAAIPQELVMKSAEADFGPEADAPLSFLKLESLPGPAAWRWLAAARKGALYAGYDPGRRRDGAALAVLDRVGNRLYTRMAALASGAPFREQKAALDGLMGAGAVLLKIDSTGMGMELAERMEADWPGAAEGFVFTARSKAALVAGLSAAFDGGGLVIPADRDLVSHITAIREGFSASGTPLYHAAETGHHSDLAWALALAVNAAKDGGPGRGADYESIERRTRLVNF